MNAQTLEDVLHNHRRENKQGRHRVHNEGSSSMVVLESSQPQGGGGPRVPGLGLWRKLFFFFLAMLRGLVPRPGIETRVPAVRAPSSNHRTAREFPGENI